jgi:hypothetical protein
MVWMQLWQYSLSAVKEVNVAERWFDRIHSAPRILSLRPTTVDFPVCYWTFWKS